MAASKPTFSAEQFEKLLPELKGKLISALDKELSDCALPELGGKAGSDLWDLPTVDSKTVCKLSPIVQEELGRPLEPKWVRKGGYESVESAIKDIIENMRKDCVPSANPAQVPKTKVAVMA